MTYQDFETEVLSKVTEQLPDSHSAKIKPIGKNNGVMLHGLIINNGHSNISPTIYLDYYYDEYNKGHTFDELIDEIMTQYHRYSLDDDFDVTLFTDYEKCRHNISYKLINYEKNKEMLKDVPHIIYLDLAIVFYCILESAVLQTSSILIRNVHLKLWNIDANDLFDIASENTPCLLSSDIINLSDIVRDILDNNIADEDECLDEDEFEKCPMYVLTNRIKLYGACCILYKNLLEEFAKQLKNDLYIIPSSIHEVLLVPKSDAYTGEYLTELVREVNATQLQPEDVLSDHVYYYSRKDDAITY